MVTLMAMVSKCHVVSCYGMCVSQLASCSLQSSKDQRLVYAGKLLTDHLQLKDVLRKVCTKHFLDLRFICMLLPHVEA